MNLLSEEAKWWQFETVSLEGALTASHDRQKKMTPTTTFDEDAAVCENDLRDDFHRQRVRILVDAAQACADLLETLFPPNSLGPSPDSLRLRTFMTQPETGDPIDDLPAQYLDVLQLLGGGLRRSLLPALEAVATITIGPLHNIDDEGPGARTFLCGEWTEAGSAAVFRVQRAVERMERGPGA